MHGETMTRNMLKDALVSGRRTPLVMLRRQAVNRDHQVEVPDGAPFRGDAADGASDKLDLDTHARELGKQDSQFVVANQGLPADNREMNRFETTSQRQHARDQGIPAIVIELAQRAAGTQMARFVRVAARTAQGALAGNFKR